MDFETSGFSGTYEVSPETVGQYTGITKNGMKIFEGDIVAFKAYTIRTIGVVTHREGAWVVVCTETAPYLHKVMIKYNGTVIGNIHDSPELLKGA